MNLPQLALSWALEQLIKALTEWRRILEDADRQNLKIGRDIEMASASIILRSAGGVRVRLVTDDAGVISGTVL